MGSLKEGKIVNEEKTKIPVFAVLKNGAILKNIFVINRPPSPSLESVTPVADDEKPDVRTDVLIVGRHPDCNIVLMHPSISRFHLQISANPSSQKLYVTDLTSVHGTWVSEKKIEPGIAIELNEGDTLRVGGSTRLYRLHWVPLSCAFEKENPFLSEMNVAMVEEREDENEEKETEMSQDDNFFVTQMEFVGETVPLVMPEKEEEESCQVIPAVAEKNGEEIQSSDSFPHGILPLLFNENSGFLGSEEIIPALFTPETAYFSPCDRKEEIKAQYKNANEVMENSVVLGEVSSEAKNDHFNEQTNTPEYHPPEETRCKKENTCMETEKEYKDLMNLDSSLSLFTTEVAELSETEKADEEKDPILSAKKHNLVITGNYKTAYGNLSLPHSEFPFSNSQQVNKDGPLVALQHLCQEGNLEKCDKDKILKEMESQSFRTKAECASVFAPTLPTESVNSSLPFEEFNDGVIDSRGAQTPESKVAGTEILGKVNDNVKQFNGSCILSEKRSSSLNIWSRRGKLATELCLQTSEWSTKIQGSTEIECESQEDSENIQFGKKFFSGSKVMDEVFSLDKENYTPNTRRKSMRKNSKLEESRTKSGTSPFASRVTSCPRTCAEEDIFALSDKENQTPKFLKQRTYVKQTSRNQVKLDQDIVLKKSVAERIPLQHIFADFPGSRMSKISTLNSASKSCNSSDYIEITQKKNHDPVTINPAHDGKRSWTVLADITSLLDKGSRKSLKLLQGLKGTRLIVPRMVISELDSLKRKGTLFRRKSEATLALDWIDECLLETKWWIDVQSSEEDKRPIESTTPASPRSHFSDGSRGGTRISVPFLVRGSILEAFSPTAENHILDCALSFRQKNNDGQLVLLSNDVTLKIKAIAEGFICETAQEFRDSLVNPFSDRFLWTGSTPRGQTWSVLDDIVLEERYYQNLLKKKSKVEGSNGLKLILPRNCHYRLMKST